MKQHGLHVLRGFMMGGADIIPGVSGGTVALILGIYRRLVTAISHVDFKLLSMLRERRFGEAARHLDLRFLIALGAGIGIGIVSLASLMHHLLTDESTRPLTLAAFFGMILASGFLVGRFVTRWSPGTVAISVLGALFAFWITGLDAVTAEPTLGYVFLSGAVAICAMILPGISGAYILLLLGMYLHVTAAIKGLPRGDLSIENLTTIAVFCAGCALGLIAFSKLLRWLLETHEVPTMALLCGFMLGSLRKIWPFKRDLTPDVHELKLKSFGNVLPEQLDAHVVGVLALAVVAALFVFAVDHFANRQPAS